MFNLEESDTKMETHSNLPAITTLAVLGSGGHTTEMLRLLAALTRPEHPVINSVHYIVASSDKRTLRMLDEYRDEGCIPKNMRPIHQIPRTRNVHQFILHPRVLIAFIHAFVQSMFILLATRPRLLLVNGPGTCVPVVLAAVIVKYFSWLTFHPKLSHSQGLNIVYVESVCRVKTLSLSAKMVRPFVDHLLVQWPELSTEKGINYIGRLV